MDKILEYRFDHEQKIIYEILKGDITLNELLQLERNKFNDPEHNASYSVILDIREANFRFSNVEKEIFYESIKDYTANLNMNRKCAILTNNPQEVVISELFKLRMSQSSPMNIKIFSTETAAMEWINT